jgi:hypothetical protein
MKFFGILRCAQDDSKNGQVQRRFAVVRVAHGFDCKGAGRIGS